jgi:hypothetical protein
MEVVPKRVPGNEALREANDLGAVCTRFANKPARLSDAGLTIKENRCCLNRSDLYRRVNVSNDRAPLMDSPRTNPGFSARQ